MVDVRNGGGETGSPRAASPSHSGPVRVEGTTQTVSAKPGKSREDKTPSKATSKTSSRRNSPQAAGSNLRPPPQPQPSASTSSGMEQPPQSQAMTATETASSQASEKESTKEPTPAPYGTRSRNRLGASRINYAEDVEMDFEMAQPPASATTSGPPSRASLATEGGQPSAAGGKKGASAAQGHASWGTHAATPKEQPPNANIPGTSTFTAVPHSHSAPPPKRRKNAASHATNGSHASATAPSQGAGGGGAGKRAYPASNAMSVANASRESTMMTFEKTKGLLVNGRLEADDGQTVSVNDQVYLVCEPPGEPYYLCRIMEFIHANGDPKSRVESLRVNWYYRPRDVQRYNNDSRLVYATMHSDVCPITSLRGRCRILHRSEIEDLDQYRKQRDSFWFNQCFDRFIHRWYEVIPTSQVINVPEKVKKALDERWKYICLETSRVKELTSAVKTCKRCVGFCASSDSVQCAVCKNTYHMGCVRPPLQKKPSRGFAWACGPCSRAQERKLEARRTPQIGSNNEDGDEEEHVDEEEEEPAAETTAPSPNDSEPEIDLHPATQAEIALAKMWPMRYLGIHCRVEDALQYDDRAIYPRASSRLGPRHQANVNVWHGHPVEFVKPAEIKKRYVKTNSHKKDAKLHKDTLAAIEADKAEKAKRPKWVMDEPPGYVHRGEDYPNKDPRCTAELLFKMPPLGVHSTRGEDDAPTVTEEQVEAYMTRAKALAKDVGVQPWSTNFLDKCLALFTKCQYDADAALKQVKKLDKRKDLHEPELTKEEEKKWNEGVAKYGSEIRSVRLHVKTISHADAVRYYYMWKKTTKGKEIWGSYSNRKGRNKKAAETETRLVDDVADDQDDSAFDNEKATQRKRGFQCKFCNTRHSRQWRRAPGVTPGQTVAADGRASKSNSTNGFLLALCTRCANLWRKYAVKWENIEEISKKVAQGGSKAWKRRIDEELLREVYAATAEAGAIHNGPDYGEPVHVTPTPAVEPPKKRQKTAAGAVDSGTSTPVSEPAPKKKEKEKPPPPPKAPTPPPVPAQPRLKVLPCAVCRQLEGERLQCVACRMTVHKSCYGVEEVRHGKFYCDTCKNDKKESASYRYDCVLCPHKVTEQELWEPPKVSHKKKTDREREKERMEKELVDKAREDYRRSQLEKGRPIYPREPLKRTADNNWVHVQCALWIPETKFTNPNRLELVEGVGAPTLRYDAVCKICKTNNGACVSCLQCHANFHVGCAHSAGYLFGFDITPVKATRRDAVPTVTINGETGSMTAAIWCKEHSPKTIVHRVNEEVEGTGLVALQLFAREFKRADLTLTGTARKANLVDLSTRAVPQATAGHPANRRTSTATSQTTAKGRPSVVGLAARPEELAEGAAVKPPRACVRCNIDVSPRWWKMDDKPKRPAMGVNEPAVSTNGVHVNGDSNVEHPLHPQALGEKKERDSSPSDAFLCQKCHWKKLNVPEETPEREKSQSVLPEPQKLPVRSPPVQSHSLPPPPALAAPWIGGGLPPPPVHHPRGPPPPVGIWHTNGHPPPSGPLHSGMGHAALTGPPVAHHPPQFHTPFLPQPNGYSLHSGGPVHPPVQAPMRPHFPHQTLPPPSHAGGAPAPPHHLSNGLLANGVHSPHLPYPPVHPHGHGAPRSSESPFTGAPPPIGPYSVHHGSPGAAPLRRRPSTPRDVVMRDAPSVTAPPPEPPRATTGASASPSLRNLLH
ncbi:uncharacterized protein EI97DRAFT_492672 [Westerdykella ornata]|uniref:BAH-domain-containing protein n=1 Tax=Westerdykella ornata TaxID=318751 RepID=A0A6A6JN91_WESOR|nr:uncharacterized protein EI97DRAFT_492672 [Westerdykella ornata]KAF2278100.1 hypothetical protein EI97DRAFT_492672 [Westerdykella ornata]